MKILTQQEMRKLEKIAIDDYQMTSRLLMENAGRSIFDYIRSLNQNFSKVIILSGLGNNGGDGFVLARQLYNKDIPFELFIIGDAEKIKGDALLNLNILKKLDVDINMIEDKYKIRSLEQIIDKNDLIIDAILGIGINGPVRELASEVIEVINSSHNMVISIDLPSGVSSDAATIENIAVKADATVTLGLPKFGNILFPGANYNGNVVVGDVGISAKIADAIESRTFIITRKLIKEYIPKRIADSHKGTYGKASVIAGSRGLSGAAILTCLAALNSGVGIIELFIPESIDLIISTKVVEIITKPLKETPNGLLDLSSISSVVKGIEESDVVAIGPGCGNSNELFELVKQVINTSNSPVVIDADGLNALAKNIEVLKDNKSQIVLTPHLGEMSRLINQPIEEIKRNKINIVKEFSKEYDVILVLKGARTIIGLPSGEIYININGNSGMSTAGSGDILTGLIGSLIAQGVEPDKAALLGVFIHGYSGDLVAEEKGEYGMLAEDIVKSIGQVFKELK